MSKKYTDEQAKIDVNVLALEKLVNGDKNHEMNVNSFLKMVRKYTAVNELTPEILRHFIDKIEVHHRTEKKLSKTQEIEFYFIGQVTIPQSGDLTQYKKALLENQRMLIHS